MLYFLMFTKYEKYVYPVIIVTFSVCANISGKQSDTIVFIRYLFKILVDIKL